MRVILWTLLGLGLVIGLLLAGLTWGPHLLRDRIAAYVGAVIGRDVAIGRIDVAPFAGRIVVSELSVASLEPGKPMLTVRSLNVDVDHRAYLTGRVVVRGVALDAPTVRVVRTAPARFDFSDVAGRFAGRPASQRKVTWHLDHVGISGGTITLDDRVVRKVSTIAGLRAALSGLTNNEDHVDRPAVLDAAFTLNGRPVAIDARTTPFARPPAVSVHARLDALPVAELLPYLTLPPDIRPTAGTIGFDLKAGYAESAAPEGPLKVEGRIVLASPRIADAAGATRVEARAVALTLAPSWPLGGDVQVAALAVEAPVMTLGRNADGSMEWPQARAGTSDTAAWSRPSVPAEPAPTPSAADRPTDRPAKRPAVGPRALRIDALTVDGARVTWRDAGLAVPLELRVAPLKIAVGGIAIADLARPGELTARGRIDATIDGHAPLGADVVLDGTAGQATLTIGRVELPRYAALAGPALKATVEEGVLDARAELRWNAADATWSVAGGGAELARLRIAHDGRQPASLQALAIDGVAIDGVARSVEVGSLKLDGAALTARRGTDGRIDLQDLYLRSDTPPAAGADGTANRADAPPATPWRLLLRQVELARLDVDYSDALIARDRKLPRLTLSGKASDVTLDPGRPVPFEAVAALSDGSRLTARGRLRPAPLDLDATLRLQRFTLTHFDPYLAPFVNLTLASGQLWGSGRLQFAADGGGTPARIRFDGEVSANEFRATDKVSGDDFLRWTALAMPSVKVDWRPARPGDSLIEIGAVAFVDFYARIILSPEGRLNLADIVVDPDRPDAGRSLTVAPEAARPGAAVAGAAARGAAVPATLAAPATGEGEPAGRAGASAVAEARPGQRVATVARPVRVPGSQPTVRVGTIRIASGNVNFTDLFIRPSYSANLTQLTGSIDAVASDRETPSDVLVTGRVDDDTPLEITGKVNPLSPLAFIDLRAVARGFDLPKLSAYSGRWAGYAIEKGKLTADVRYRIEGERLQAENRITINQLTFGEKVESPDALNLPVRLAVSLLKDSNGNIDLDLPISGTLSDPQFSLGGLLLRALGNLIRNVVTSPFKALASLAGGTSAAELSHIEFPAGSAALDDEDRRRLDALGKAMAERPGLSLEIAGYADPQTDRDAMQRERLELSLKSTKLARMKRADPAAELPALREVVLEPAERSVLLEQAWRDGKLDAGGAKPPPPERIEELLIERAPIAAEEVKQIAQQRAQAARDFLRDSQNIANERLYLLAPRIAEAGDKLSPRRTDFEIK